MNAPVAGVPQSVTPGNGRYPHLATATRFWLKVYQRGDCWEWRARRTSEGYGQFQVDGRKIPAHRFAYEAAKGPIPPGFEPDHLCRHTWCVRPSHLEAVLSLINRERSTFRARNRNVLKTHCPQGHPYSSRHFVTKNLAFERRCSICRREQEAARRRRRAQ